MKTAFITSIVFAFCCCSANNKQTSSVSKVELVFSERKIQNLQWPTDIIVWNNYILCLQDSGEIIVRDTNLNIVDSLSKKLESQRFSSFKKVNDTVLLSKIGDEYFLDSAFAIKKYFGNLSEISFGKIYDDSTYNFSGHGDITFFLNKKTGKTYGYSISKISQAFKFKHQYYLSTNYRHYSAFLKLTLPDSLFEFKGWENGTESWTITDKTGSWKAKPLEAITEALVPETTFNYYNFLVTFPYKEQLYTIFTTDSLTLLAQHENKRLKVIDTIFKKPTYGTPKTCYLEDMIINRNAAGFFIIKGNHITIAKF